MSDTAADELRRELRELPQALLTRLSESGFDAERLVELARPLFASERARSGPGNPSTEASGQAGEQERTRRDRRNRVQGPVSAPSPEDVRSVPDSPAERAALRALGEPVLERGELAFCVMAGGMATRMGGLVKALVNVMNDATFLDLRLRENAHWQKRLNVPVPLWLMTSDVTDAPIRARLREADAPPFIRTFRQDVGVRLTPTGRLFRDDEGSPSIYATGHGDLVDAVRRSGLLSSFVAGGGKYVWITNLDNLGATIDPELLGLFIRSGADVMVELVEKAKGDKGGIPVFAQNHLQVLEEFRLPVEFDATQVPVFNTNTFLIRAEALARVDVQWNWFEVEKKVGDRTAVQFERLLQELTAALKATYVCVPRDGAASRFLPVKDHDELARRREQIGDVVRSRGML